MGARIRLIIPGILVLVGYVGVLGAPFVYDDLWVVAKNKLLLDPWNFHDIFWANIYRPATNLGLAWNRALLGDSPASFRVVNLALHVLNVTLFSLILTRLARRLPGDEGSAARGGDVFSRREAAVLFAACLFAVHPLFTEGVTYISSRSGLQATAFFLAAFLFFIKSEEAPPGRGFFGLSFLFYLFGCLSKETAATLPLTLLATGLLLPPRTGGAGRFTWRRHAPFLLVLLIAGAGRVFLLLRPGAHQWPRPLGENLLLQAEAVTGYVYLFLAPFSLSVQHHFEGPVSFTTLRTLASVTAAIGAALAALALRGRSPAASLAVLWYFITLLPSSSIVPLTEPMAEHRVYLPGTALCALAGMALWRVLGDRDGDSPEGGGGGRRPFAALFPASLLVILALAGAVMRNRVWTSEANLWADAARKAPRSARARFALANALFREKRYDEAFGEYREAERLNPRDEEALMGEASVLVIRGEKEKARKIYKKIVEGNARFRPALNNLGSLAYEERRFGEAAAYYRRSLSLDPYDFTANVNLARILENRDPEAAARHYELALHARPNYRGAGELRERVEKLRGTSP